MLPSRENLCKLTHLLTFQGLPILLATAFSLAQLNATTIWVASGSNTIGVGPRIGIMACPSQR